MKASRSPGLVFDPAQLEAMWQTTRVLLKKMSAAIKILELNAQEYLNNSMVFETLGEYYGRSGKKKKQSKPTKKQHSLIRRMSTPNGCWKN